MHTPALSIPVYRSTCAAVLKQLRTKKFEDKKRTVAHLHKQTPPGQFLSLKVAHVLRCTGLKFGGGLRSLSIT